MDVWDDLRRGAKSVVDESQRLARVARLKGQIKALELKLGERLYDLGTRTLDLHRRNELHHFELDETFVELEGLQRELREKEREVESLLRLVLPRARPAGETCFDCGGRIAPEDRFCRACGADLKGTRDG